MKLTTKSEYSIAALIYIARYQKDGYVKVDDICAQYGFSKKYLEQMLVSLRQARFITAKRGALGGYRLAVAPEKITLAQVIRFMDGALAPTLAVSKYFYEETPLEKEKKVLRVFKNIRDYISEKMETVTIADLL